MENIQTEEEAQPLASPRRHVAQAYKTNDRQNACKKYSFWLLAFIAFVVVSLGGTSDDRKSKRAKKLRNKAETMPEVEVQKLQDLTKKVEMNEKMATLNDAHAMFEDSEDASLINDMMEDEDDLDREVEKVLSGVDMAEEDEIEMQQGMLTTAVKTVEDSVKYYLGNIFGYGDDADDDDDDDDDVAGGSEDIKLSEEQLDMIAKKISERLENDAKAEFRAKADAVKEEKANEIDKVLTEDRGARMNAKDIAEDVHEVEQVVVEDLKEEIDVAASRVKDALPEKVKKIRNDVVQEVTGKKLDEIEQKRRTRKERKEALVKKFHEMQAKAKEAEAKKGNLNDKLKGSSDTKSDGSKSGQDDKGVSKGGRYPEKRTKKQGSSGDDASKESEPSVDKSPWRQKPRSADEEELATKKRKRRGSDGSEDEPSAEPEISSKDEEANGSEDEGEDEENEDEGEENEDEGEDEENEDEVNLASGRRDEDASEDG